MAWGTRTSSASQGKQTNRQMNDLERNGMRLADSAACLKRFMKRFRCVCINLETQDCCRQRTTTRHSNMLLNFVWRRGGSHLETITKPSDAAPSSPKVCACRQSSANALCLGCDIYSLLGSCFQAGVPWSKKKRRAFFKKKKWGKEKLTERSDCCCS